MKKQDKGEIKSNFSAEPRFKKLPRAISMMTSTQGASLREATEFVDTDGLLVCFGG
ncbi:MAG: hypothetical protein PHO08_05755 [Methylococcales bacterium]|nr:hypothetical protein [Methylococcales bacterium]MDD5630860.1 hypothetical protein [Methylococcales bacterium]